MSYEVSPKEINRLTLNETDTIASVKQNIAILLSTRQQTIPLYREFGLPMQFIDKPMPVAKAMLIAEVRDAIAQFEPRARLINVRFEMDKDTPGKIIPVVEVEINNE